MGILMVLIVVRIRQEIQKVIMFKGSPISVIIGTQVARGLRFVRTLRVQRCVR